MGKESNPCTGLDRPSELQVVEALRISRQSAPEGGNVTPGYRTPLPPGNFPGTHFW